MNQWNLWLTHSVNVCTVLHCCSVSCNFRILSALQNSSVCALYLEIVLITNVYNL